MKTSKPVKYPKASDVLLRAAELESSPKECEYSGCNAIQSANFKLQTNDNYSIFDIEYSESPADDAFEYFKRFKPREKCLYWWDFSDKGQSARILALLFSYWMAKDDKN
jgi:hypothetical protein